MATKKTVVFPQHRRKLEVMGENIKLARKRRGLTAAQVAERAGINRTTLYHIEKGAPQVSFGAYFNVLRTLGLHEDLLRIAADDPFGRNLQDLKLLAGKEKRKPAE
jgi:transcriptional regulator with XRE-family HTH domain